jgi:hypothetical protein
MAAVPAELHAASAAEEAAELLPTVVAEEAPVELAHTMGTTMLPELGNGGRRHLGLRAW